MMKKSFSKIIGWFGYKIIETKIIKNNRIISNYSYLKLDKILDYIFTSTKIKTAIQIGANDGKRFDNLNLFLKKYKCKTILVEPIKEFFNQLKKNYKDQQNIIFENSAISSENTLLSLYTVKQNKLKEYDEHIAGISSSSKNHLLKHGVKNVDIIEKKINSLTIKQLLIKHKFDNLDLLYLDTEGHDGKILNNFLEDNIYEPIIIFEYIHIETITFERLVKKLNNKKYNFFSIDENLICFPKKYKVFL